MHRAKENQTVYLDYNATTPVASEVLDTIHYALKECWGNPSSSHHYGIDFYYSFCKQHIKLMILTMAVWLILMFATLQ